MDYKIRVRKPELEIFILNQNLTLLKARNNLRWLQNNKCINCKDKCNDCIIDYNDKISIEKVLDYLDKIIPKRSIKGFYKFGGEK